MSSIVDLAIDPSLASLDRDDKGIRGIGERGGAKKIQFSNRNSDRPAPPPHKL